MSILGLSRITDAGRERGSGEHTRGGKSRRGAGTQPGDFSRALERSRGNPPGERSCPDLDRGRESGKAISAPTQADTTAIHYDKKTGALLPKKRAAVTDCESRALGTVYQGKMPNSVERSERSREKRPARYL